MSRLTPILACFVTSALFAGCHQGPDETRKKESDQVDKPAPVSADPKSAKIEMVPIKFKDLLDKHIAPQKGKVVVVDLWGYFCPPCKDEFPNLVRMHHAYRDKGVVCMSLSLDYSDKYKAKAIEFLNEKKSVCPNFLLDEETKAAQDHWNFEAVPVCVVYGKDGKIARIFKADDKSFTYPDDVEPFVKTLLAP